MRVMMLSWEYPPRIVGGISPHVYELSQELLKIGVEVHVVTKSTPNAPMDETEASGVHVHRVDIPGTPTDFLHEIQLLNQATDIRVRQLLEDWRPGGQPTIFHAHDWLSLDSARELKYEYKLPMVATVHATEHGRHGGIHNPMSRYIHDQEYWLTYEAWRVIVCTEFMKGEVHRYFNCPWEKIDVIFNGVNASKFDFDWTAEERAVIRAQYAKADEKIVLYVGRFVREKGIQNLLNSIHAVLAEAPNTKFVLVGGGNRDRFEGFVNWAGLSEHVHFTGFLSGRQLLSLYRCADIAVFPSLYEPFGIVALEAMAAGAAVVCSDAGGLPEVVLHDQTGTTTYAGDSASLAWGILHELKNPERSVRLKAAAIKRLETDFQWGRIAQQTLAVYERIWAEFLTSYWADGTVWPVSPGAEERAKELHLEEKATSGAIIERQDAPIHAAPRLLQDPETDSEPEDDFWSPAF
jgi:glycosyltransferase involved in cell wall biosynthesis